MSTSRKLVELKEKKYSQVKKKKKQKQNSTINILQQDTP